MERQPINLAEQSIESLKAIAYDLIVQRDDLNNQITVLKNEIHVRQTNQTQPKDKTE